MKPDSVTAIVLTFNEAPNIGRCLAMLGWVSRVIVVDSGSSDDTHAICGQFPNVTVVHRAFDTFAGQCNFALSLVTTEWVLSLDADYILPGDFNEHLSDLSGSADGYSCGFRYLIYGRPLRGCLYPARTVLYRKASARYEDVGHGHRVMIEGRVERLDVQFDHDDRKPLSRWLDSQRRYAEREAVHLPAMSAQELGFADRIRLRIWLAVPAVVFYVLIWKRCLLDGWPGMFYAFQRAYAELLLSLELLDRKLRREESSVDSRRLQENLKGTVDSSQ